jgi:hypothetical protein
MLVRRDPVEEPPHPENTKKKKKKRRDIFSRLCEQDTFSSSQKFNSLPRYKVLNRTTQPNPCSAREKKPNGPTVCVFKVNRS